MSASRDNITSLTTKLCMFDQRLLTEIVNVEFFLIGRTTNMALGFGQKYFCLDGKRILAIEIMKTLDERVFVLMCIGESCKCRHTEEYQVILYFFSFYEIEV